MRIIINVDDELGAKIDAAAEKLDIKRGEWVKLACAGYLDESQSDKQETVAAEITNNKNEDVIESLNKEILTLKDELEMQGELKNTYSKLISEKDQRIEDLKESISRIEAMSITTTDQISSSKDERINDLTNMIEHLQAQAAAHSVALQSAIKPALESKNGKSNSETEDELDMIQKPKWMFWK